MKCECTEPVSCYLSDKMTKATSAMSAGILTVKGVEGLDYTNFTMVDVDILNLETQFRPINMYSL